MKTCFVFILTMNKLFVLVFISLVYQLFSLSQPHKGYLTSKLNFKTVLVIPSLDPSLIFPFHLLPSPTYPTGFSFCFFPGFLAIFNSLSLNNNISSYDHFLTFFIVLVISLSDHTSTFMKYCIYLLSIMFQPRKINSNREKLFSRTSNLPYNKVS